MLYPCIFCIDLSKDWVVVCVACLTVFHQKSHYLGFVVDCYGIVECEGWEGCMLDRPCMVFHRVCACCDCDHSVHLVFHFIGCVFVCRKLSPYLRV